MAKITFIVSDETYTVPSGTELLAAKRKFPDMPLKFGCTRGDCGVCAIRVVSGKNNLTKVSTKEIQTLKMKKLSNNEDYRLACQCVLNGDISIDA